MKKEVLNFQDFFNHDIISEGDLELQSTTEEISIIDTSEIDFKSSIEEDDSDISDLNLTNERLKYLIEDFDLTDDDISSIKEMSSEKDKFYNLYRDTNENFVCDIFIEGSNPDKANVRIVLESNEWNLIFNGWIENGKCHIPIKKLDILNENLIGDIKLEVLAEGNVFVPWQDKFVIKSSKSVKTLNESIKKDIDVKVGLIK